MAALTRAAASYTITGGTTRGLRWCDPDRGGKDRRRDAADRSGLGAEVQQRWS